MTTNKTTPRPVEGAAQAARQVSQTAVEQGKQIAQETSSLAKNLIEQAQTRLKDQAGAQQKQAAERLRVLGDELRSMVEKSGQSGTASNLVNEISTRMHRV